MVMKSLTVFIEWERMCESWGLVPTNSLWEIGTPCFLYLFVCIKFFFF